jgi:GTP-binding protein
MEIKNPTFIKSSQKLSELPEGKYPEYAFVGRSNVGKSSLINKLCNRNKLAKTSSTPGKTQLINHFLIDESWYLVDLPGYGYAKVSKKQRSGFQKMITSYVTQRENLMNLFVLVDSRIKPQAIDLEFMEFLGVEEVPFSIIFTKIDKPKKGAFEKNLQLFREALLETWAELPPMFFTSAIRGDGTEEVLDYIASINSQFPGEG